MKHHLYQIYYGGFKHKLKNWKYCKECNLVITQKMHDGWWLSTKKTTTKKSLNNRLNPK